ncbi:hypothetical protein GXE18_24295 [Salmonella enterica]|nr:hypothetical protein [Salmonella enterica]
MSNSMVYMQIDDEQIDNVLALFSDLDARVIKLAYHRALRRTEATVKQLAARMMRDRLKLKAGLQKRLKGRIQAYMKPSSTADEMKFWFGLNNLDPLMFRGGAKRAPGGLMIRGTYYERAFVAIIHGKKKVMQREGAARNPVNRLTLPISDEMIVALEDELFVAMPEIFLRHFETDLRGRVKSEEWKSGWSDRQMSSAANSIGGW